MKKLISILILNFFLISSSVEAGPTGRGELKLSPTAVNAFIDYLKTYSLSVVLEFSINNFALDIYFNLKVEI